MPDDISTIETGDWELKKLREGEQCLCAACDETAERPPVNSVIPFLYHLRKRTSVWIASNLIFGVFNRPHGQEYKGTGIGLAMCQKIIDRNGGGAFGPNLNLGRVLSSFHRARTLRIGLTPGERNQGERPGERPPGVRQRTASW
jgi:hypothetical protein